MLECTGVAMSAIPSLLGLGATVEALPGGAGLGGASTEEGGGRDRGPALHNTLSPSTISLADQSADSLRDASAEIRSRESDCSSTTPALPS